jgi:hypothetical protein
MQDDSGSSNDEPRDGPPSRRHPMMSHAGWDWLWDQARSIHEEIGRIKYQGEQVYHTPTNNALASRMLIDQLTPHLSKDNEEVNAQVKRLQDMLDIAIIADLVLDCDDRI